MNRPLSHHWGRIIRTVVGLSLGCALAAMPLSVNAQLRGTEGGYQTIPGQIPPSILKKISAIHPGTTKAEFYKMFDPYTPGLTQLRPIKAGPSPHIFHYVYRFAYVRCEPVMDAYKQDLSLLKDHPKQVRWTYLRRNGHANEGMRFLVLIDVRWKFAPIPKGRNSFQQYDIHGNPDDVIMEISNPYLVYDIGISG